MASSTLKIEATCSTEMTVDFQRITLPYMQEDRTFREGIKFEVLTAVIMNNSIFWDVTPGTLAEVCRSCRGTPVK
jgi:hypothetical protein